MDPGNTVVQNLKRKIITATAIAALRQAKREGVDLTQKELRHEYIRNLQDQFIRENYDEINPALIQKYLSHHQSRIFSELKKVISVHSEDQISTGGVNWIDDCNGPGNAVTKSKARMNVESCELAVNAIKNMKFVEAIVTILDEIESKSQVTPSKLHELLYDEAEHSSQSMFCSKAVEIEYHKNSEDSGIASIDQFPDNSLVSRKVVPGAVINHVLRSTKTNTVVLDSLGLIVDYIKSEIALNPTKVFFNWSDSEIENACTILCKCSQKGVDYEEVVINLIIDLLQDVWSDKQVNQLKKWEMKIYIVKKLLSTTRICYEVLQSVSDIFDCIRNLIKKNCSAPLMMDKLALFLSLYPDICRNLIQSSKLESTGHKKSCEVVDVSTLWQAHWCHLKNDDSNDADLTPVIKTDFVPKLEKLLISISNSHPLISVLAAEALRLLNQLDSESETSQNMEWDILNIC